MNLHDLNDDCLCLIFQLLDMQDQISAARTCVRFYALLSSMWQRTYHEFSIYTEWTNTSEEFAVFMESICTVVQKMDLGCLTKDEWNVLKLYSYPNLRHLTRIDAEIASDECLLKMTEIFPNLESLTLTCTSISGKYIEKWPYLKDLDLSLCENVKFSHFQSILEGHQLRSMKLGIFDSDDDKWTSEVAFNHFCDLEEISLSSEELSWVTDLSRFANLKVLEVDFLRNTELVLKVVGYIATQKCNDLVELRASTEFPFNALLQRTFGNLQKFNIKWQDMTDLTDIFRWMPSLREMFIIKCKGLRKDDIYRWISSNQMEHITIEECSCDFREFRIHVDDIARHRTTQLHFNFHNNEFSNGPETAEITLNAQGKNALLKITSESLEPYRLFENQFRFL